MTPLSYALLGLVQLEPRTGYALRKVFETTPMGNYSSSPGSIYPALKALETAGLVETRGPETARGKGLYHLTGEGEAALGAWLRAPVGDLEEAMLRFAFLRDDDRMAILAFLDSFQVAAEAQVAGLVAFLASDAGQTLSPKSRMAVEHGRHRFQASADWASWARTNFTDEEGKSR